MKDNETHWYNLEPIERKVLKEKWERSAWRKASCKDFYKEPDFIYILLTVSEFLLGILSFVYFRIIHIDDTVMVALAVLSIIIFLPAVMINIVGYEEKEYKKWLLEKHNILK